MRDLALKILQEETNGYVSESRLRDCVINAMMRFKDEIYKTNDTTLSIDGIIEIINKLPHSKSRVPYTYHHDYLRDNVEIFKFSSRSEVASKHIESEIELYIIALAQLFNEIGFEFIQYLSPSDINYCKSIIDTTKEIIKRYIN